MTKTEFFKAGRNLLRMKIGFYILGAISIFGCMYVNGQARLYDKAFGVEKGPNK